VESQVGDPSRARSQARPARLGESAKLPEWLAGGRGLLEEIRTSLDTRYATEGEEEPDVETPPWRPIALGLATFVPTFLLVVIGLPYLLVPTAAPPATPGTMPLASTTLLGSSPPASMARSAVPLPEFLETWPLSDKGANSDPAGVSKPESVEPKPLTSVSGDTASWARAAAFADQHAAGRLTATLRKDGYRVDLRREDSATLRWEVWISKSPAPSRPPTERVDPRWSGEARP
jgi:hypothetical protein